MTKIRNMILVLIVSLFICQSSKSMETDRLLEQTNRYGICIPITVPTVAKAQWIHGEFAKHHDTSLIIPHITLLQAHFTNDQLSKVTTFLAEYVASKNSFEITMSPQIVAAGNNNTFWDVDNTSNAWSKLQEMHLFLKTQFPNILKSQINFIGKTHPHYRPHCTVAYNTQDESLNDQINQDLSKMPYYLKFVPHFIALVNIDSVGNIKNVLQYFHLHEDLIQNKIDFHTDILLSNPDNSPYGAILALLLEKHYLNKVTNQVTDKLNTPPSEESSSEEE